MNDDVTEDDDADFMDRLIASNADFREAMTGRDQGERLPVAEALDRLAKGNFPHE